MNNSNSIYLLLFSLMILASCGKEDTAPETGSGIEGYARGVFISCEGSFNANNGSVSWYNADSNKIVNNLFEKINGRPAGDVVQSFALAGDYGVIVANNSQKIEMVDLETFESVTTITGFSYPRYFVYSGNGTGYVSNGRYDGQVFKIDIHTGTINDSITVGMGPEQMIISGNYLFVANSGGWGYDNSVSVIDIRNGEVAQTLTVGDIPVALVADRDNNVWVLCRGKDKWTDEETDSKLVRINSQTMTVDTEIIIGQKGDDFNPSWLSVSPGGETLYFGEAEGLYAMSIDAGSQPSEPFIGEIFTTAGVHPETGKIFALEVTDFSSPGKLHIYHEGNLSNSMETGIAPGGIVFSAN